MATQRLLINDEQGPFYFAVHEGALTVGAGPDYSDLVLSPLRVVRIRCEVEVEEGPVVVDNDPTTEDAPPRGHELQPGDALRVGPVHLRLVASGALAGAAAATNGAAPAAVGKRLLVVEGADEGKVFPLGDVGPIAIGNSHKHAQIVLHDLYVARVHCELHVESGHYLVKHMQGRNGTLINGKEVLEQELHLGDVLRVGNSQLRYEIGSIEPAVPHEPADESETHSVAAAGGRGDAARTPAPAPSPSDSGFTSALMQLESHVLGQYQFGELLGRGQSGLVFRAQHRQTNQTVALKVLSPEFPQTDAELQHFVRALRAVAPLRHAHLVTLYTAGKTGRYCWIARELVEGESLVSLIRRLQEESKLGWKRACRVAVHLAKVLDYLHTHQAAPVRITPSNILLERDTKTTKLADVMLDHALRGSRLEKIIHEKKQLIELPFTAPELLEPGATADHRAGLYALGAVLYTLLTGLPPYSGVSSAEILARMRDGKLVRPSKTVLDTPPPFEGVVLRLLARRPEDRFQSAAEVLGVVEPIANIHEIRI
jgi:pSer/pThr/pTyr-binding forkhead associated (FHA) protein